MFSALSQNYQHLLSKLSNELKNGIEILVGQIVFKGGYAHSNMHIFHF